MKTILKELIRKGINEETVVIKDIINEFAQQHITYCEGKFDAITDYVTVFEPNIRQEKYRINFQDSKIVSIYRLNIDGEDCEPVFDRQYIEMYDLIHNTLYDFADAECEMSYNSFKNTLESMKFDKYGTEYSVLEYIVLDYNLGTEAVVKIGLNSSPYWQYAIYFTCPSIFDDTVMVTRIKDYGINYDIYSADILEG